jgi:thiol-disulfide isomerase/thioredoxin
MKKILTIITLIAVLMATFVGCYKTNKADQENVLNYDQLGIKISLKEHWKEFKNNLLQTPVYGNEQDSISGLMVDFGNDEALKDAETIEDSKNKEEKKFSKSKRLFAIATVQTDKVSMDTLEETVGGPAREAKVEKIAENDGLCYYFCSYQYDDSELSDASKTTYKKLYDDMQNLKKNIKTFKPVHRDTIKDTKKLTFKTKDMNGNEVTSDIFNKSKITMVNIWATFCNPCIKEMPDIQALSEELKEKNISVIGIVGDTADKDGNADEDNVQLAKNIIEEKKINYTNLLFNKELSNNLPVDAYPTTILIDNEGNVIGEPIVGSKSKEEYNQILLKALDSVKN